MSLDPWLIAATILGVALLIAATVNPGSPVERLMPGLFSGVELHAGDVMADERGGGASLGDPRQRDFTRVLDDVLDGYVSRDAAIERYGADPARLDAALAAWREGALSRASDQTSAMARIRSL